MSEVAGKGWGWYAIPASNENKKIETTATAPSSSSSSSSSTSTPTSLQQVQQVAQSAYSDAYSGVTNAYSSLYVPSLTSFGRNGNPSSSLNKNSSEDDGISDSSTTISGMSKNSKSGNRRRRKSMLSPTLLKLVDNPYIGVRGGGRLHSAKPPHESMDAVRKLLSVVDEVKYIPPQRRPSSPSVHFGNNEEGNHPNVTIRTSAPPPLTPTTSRQIPTATDGSSSATPIHRNNATTADNNNTSTATTAWNNNTKYSQEELPMHSLLPQQLSTIESMDDRQARAEQDPNNRAQEISNNNNNDVKKASSSSNSHSPEETASQLTEGTLRAMRDLALDEALELHASLKYWTDRWERPVFSWFVAGPLVWFNWIINTSHNTAAAAAKNPGGGYDHAVMVGQRVSQIQAVLARRLAAIGELQHHLLRAGWQRGVAHWGFLGEGGNWAAVDGTDGRMIDDDGDDCSHHNSFDEDDSDHDEYEDDEEDNNMILYEEQQDDQHYDSEHFFAADPQPDHNTTMMNNNNVNNKFNDNNVNNTIIKPLDLHQSVHHQQQQYRNHRYRLLRREHSEASVGSIGLHIDVPPLPPPGLSNTPRRAVASARMSQHNERRKQGSSLYYTNLHVRKRNGGHIQKNDPAMAEWSIDALALIRSQLIRAANGKIALPYSENWPFNQQHVVTTGNASVVEDQISLAALDRGNQNGMPAWAGMKYITSSSSSKTRSRMESRGSCCFSVSEHVDNNHHDRTNSGGSIHGTAGASYTETFPKIGADCFESHPLGEEETPKVEAHSKPKRRSPSQMSMSSTVKERAVVGISNLPLMMNEVSSILDVMEDIMDIQRARRLEKLKPPSWWRQNWFLVAMGPPTLTYLLYNNLIGKGQTWNLVRYATETMLAFSREHVVEPCYALYDEFTKGPESISDHAARDTVTETLKKMIRSWLDET